MGAILIVDDSGYARRVHRKMLEAAGHRVAEAASGMEAIEAYFLERPDVIMLDLSMEDMGGLDVLTRLREMDPAVRAIVVSADVQKSTEQLVSDAGALRFLGKPVSPERLVEAIAEVLQADAS
jgi:two-component system chemotaxis response regulator CheY